MKKQLFMLLFIFFWKVSEQNRIIIYGGITMKYECEPCGYVYDPATGDPDNGIEPGTAFEDLPEDWVCPLCGAGKEEFSPVEE